LASFFGLRASLPAFIAPLAMIRSSSCGSEVKQEKRFAARGQRLPQRRRAAFNRFLEQFTVSWNGELL